MSQPELVFLHIPKTAGTSQRQLFNGIYGRENVFWYGIDSPGKLQYYPADAIGDSPLVGGHQPLSFYPRDYDPLYCAIVRNPLERVISLYAHYAMPEMARSTSGRERREKMLREMLKTGFDRDSMLRTLKQSKSFRAIASNMQCAYLSHYEANFGGVLKSLERFDFILGTLNHYELFHREISDLLAWPEKSSGVFNRSKSHYAQDYLENTELTELILELNTEDSKLYEFMIAEHGGLLIHIRNRQNRLQRLQRLLSLVDIDSNRSGGAR